MEFHNKGRPDAHYGKKSPASGVGRIVASALASMEKHSYIFP